MILNQGHIHRANIFKNGVLLCHDLELRSFPIKVKVVALGGICSIGIFLVETCSKGALCGSKVTINQYILL